MAKAPLRSHRIGKIMQVTIFGASSDDLLEQGVDLERCLNSLGYTSAIVDLDVPDDLASLHNYDSEDAGVLEDSSVFAESPQQTSEQMIPDFHMLSVGQAENDLTSDVMRNRSHSRRITADLPASVKRGRSPHSRTCGRSLNAVLENKKKRRRPKSVPPGSSKGRVSSTPGKHILTSTLESEARRKRNALAVNPKKRGSTSLEEQHSPSSPEQVVQKKRSISVTPSKQWRAVTSEARSLSNRPKDGVQEGDSITTEDRGARPRSGSIEYMTCTFPGCKSARMQWNKTNLVNHARIHWGKSVVQCHYCDAGFVTYSRFRYHCQKLHEGEKPKNSEILRSEEDRTEFKNVWLQCFPSVPFPTY